jgi:hypothetical protein
MLAQKMGVCSPSMEHQASAAGQQAGKRALDRLPPAVALKSSLKDVQSIEQRANIVK